MKPERVVSLRKISGVQKQKWTFAKTYANTAPHEYFLEKENEQLFKRLKKHIKQYGKKEWFLFNGKRWEYTYLYLGDYRYWAIGEVMNRTKIKNVGRKDGVSFPVVHRHI